MAKDKKATIHVQGLAVSIISQQQDDYISIEFDGIKNIAGSNSFSLTPKHRRSTNILTQK